MKTWVLAVSVDQQMSRTLVTDSRGVYEASLLNADGSQCKPCIITGYPILDTGDAKALGNAVANRDDWNKILMAHKVHSMRRECIAVVGIAGTDRRAQVHLAVDGHQHHGLVI